MKCPKCGRNLVMTRLSQVYIHRFDNPFCDIDRIIVARKGSLLLVEGVFEKLRKATEKEKQLQDQAIMNCLVGKIRKTKTGKVIIPLTDLFGQRYGKVELEDDFGLDLLSVDNVSLQRIYSKRMGVEEKKEK